MDNPSAAIWNEQEMIAQLLSGDTAAFSGLYDRYSGALYGLILNIVENEADAENLLQDAFVKIWRNFKYFDPEKGRLFTFLAIIARRAALDFIRSAYKSNQRIIQTTDAAVSIESPSPEMAKVDFIGLDALLLKLKPEQREIIDLIYFQGLTQQEVSDALQLPLGTVKSRCRTTLLHLRTILEVN
ncbi:MAG: sigma-70 family RNA polymerase sigma factor [Saprospiraceae bacterium]|nr:sigma-70 family RNA polymerase sigma factor [Saprospiraceae bacterium]